MKQIAVEHLYPGLPTPGVLQDRTGAVLIEAGICLSEDDLARIKKAGCDGVYGDCNWNDEFTLELDEDRSDAVAIASLRPGMRLPRHIYAADNNILLLAAGVEITGRFLELLSTRGVTTVKLRSKDTERNKLDCDELQSEETSKLDAVLENVLKKSVPLRELSSAERPRLGLPDLKAETESGVELHTATSDFVADVCEMLNRGRRIPGYTVREAIGRFATLGALDIDLLPMVVSMQRTQGEYLFDHCVNVALISMSMAAQAGMDPAYITEIGFGAILQDIGMLRVPPELRLAPRILLSDELFEIRRHPILTLDWLEKVGEAPLGARFIGYQSHERIDGRGYPRQRTDAFVHQYAKMVSVADAYAAMTRSRPYRGPLRAYDAAKSILEDVNKFDRTAVRLFLDTVGLFPTGSCVELDSGIRGKVIRAKPGQHTRPVIEELSPDGRLTGRLIDLSRDTTVQITRPIECPNAGPHIA